MSTSWLSQKSREVRIWRKLETLVNYLHSLGVKRFDADASAYTRTRRANTRPERAAVLKKAQEAAGYDASGFAPRCKKGLMKLARASRTKLSRLNLPPSAKCNTLCRQVQHPAPPHHCPRALTNIWQKTAKAGRE